MRGCTLLLFSEAPSLHGQEAAVIAAYRNVLIQDDPGMHFRWVIRNVEDQRRWHCRSSESDAGKALNTWLTSDGPPGQ